MNEVSTKLTIPSLLISADSLEVEPHAPIKMAAFTNHGQLLMPKTTLANN